ncbi:hypothetical protein [Paenibacillus sp. Marseille-Q4541]|uniref:hypothetical protein n=1 Tax=Paenibacillus sp. Marseille-Q4541 TaxID=2831522 RepID=UPI001BA9AC3F|nr:hypothetical protein [Paenibacillus sp. Marseille-Q4541]
MEQKQYRIMNKDRKSRLAALFIMLTLLIIVIFQSSPDHVVLNVFLFIVITAYILLIGYEIYYYFTYNRASKKQFLIIDEDRLILHNQVVLPTQIDLIISEGFIHSSIGIKLTNHRWIPQRLQFLFADQHTEQEAFDQLQEWAAKYQIEIRDGKVRSLL